MWNIRILILSFLFCSFANGQMVINSYRFGCSAHPNQIHTSANAVSDPNCNEADATTGWSTVQTTLTSIETDPQAGLSHFSAVSTEGNSDRIEYSFSATSGNTYQVTFKVKEISGNCNVTSWAGFSDGPSLDGVGPTWESKTYNVTANATGTAVIRIYCNLSGGAAGNTFYLDDFSVINTTP